MKVFSGIRPSGQLHIGNYLGAMRQWIKLQEIHDCIFCIVDLHAITTPYEPGELQKNITDAAIIYLAAGLDPEKVAQHLEMVSQMQTKRRSIEQQISDLTLKTEKNKTKALQLEQEQTALLAKKSEY